MNSRQRSRLNMLHQLLHFLDSNQAVWENEVLIASQINDLKKLQAELKKVVNLEEQLSRPFAVIRDEEREQFNHTFSQLAGWLHSKFMETGQKDKAYLSKMTPREFMRDSLQKVLAKANNMMESAIVFKDDLESQPSTKAMYEAALEWQGIFQRNMMIPSERKRLRKQALERLQNLQEEIMAFLENHLDMNMRILSTIDANFYNGYVFFRKVSGRKAKNGTSKETVSGLPDNGSTPPDTSTEDESSDLNGGDQAEDSMPEEEVI